MSYRPREARRCSSCRVIVTLGGAHQQDSRGRFLDGPLQRVHEAAQEVDQPPYGRGIETLQVHHHRDLLAEHVGDLPHVVESAGLEYLGVAGRDDRRLRTSHDDIRVTASGNHRRPLVWGDRLGDPRAPVSRWRRLIVHYAELAPRRRPAAGHIGTGSVTGVQGGLSFVHETHPCQQFVHGAHFCTATAQCPKIARPMRTMVDPSSIATSKSSVMPMLSAIGRSSRPDNSSLISRIRTK